MDLLHAGTGVSCVILTLAKQQRVNSIEWFEIEYRVKRVLSRRKGMFYYYKSGIKRYFYDLTLYLQNDLKPIAHASDVSTLQCNKTAHPTDRSIFRSRLVENIGNCFDILVHEQCVNISCKRLYT